MSKYDPQPTDVWSLAIMFCCMTLRRFPWKAPRLSDNSYKLFVTTPHDGPKPLATVSSPELAEQQQQQQQQSDGRAARSEPTTRQASDAASGARQHHHHREGSRSESVGGERPPSAHSRDKDQPASASSSSSSQSIRGPWRLLRLLPRETRSLIGRMLDVDPKQRATLADMHADRWVLSCEVCSQEEGGRVIRMPGHDHTLEPSAGVTTSSAGSKK